MIIHYKDFSPSAVEHKVFSTEYESFSEVVAHANEWIRDSGVTVLNVETVVLPNLQEIKDKSQAVTIMKHSGSYMFQVVRVWYNGEKSIN